MMLYPAEFKELQEHVSSLAQELQDMILEFVLQTEEQEVQIREWRPSLALRISSATRRKYAPAYFAKTLYVIDWSDFDDWAEQLTDWHVRHIKQVGLDDTPEPDELHDEDHCWDPDECRSLNSAFLRDFLWNQRQRQGEWIRKVDVQHLDRMFAEYEEEEEE
ncbi:hypothetical protein CBER1_03204 [Cercospora berteroae]|uniref:Uncharacterized protein n=1 Tax=Cercospora berteroae TaxID=357750 RepID=A0A2S6CL72_9PEZI|nr:hypothetical protein CBER1_03204 [Cercospora berteroae]